MPHHHTYIETHLGGGAVMRNKIAAEKNIGIDLDQSVISRWHQEHEGACELVLDDALNFLKNYEFVGGELVYADPPYLLSTRRREKIYRHEYADQNHIDLLQVLTRLPCHVMISGYDNELYAQQLSGWRLEKFNAQSHVGIREECVWMNFEPPKKLHDVRYLGSNYRERQTITRRRTRLYERIEKMDAVERGELIRWVNSKYALEAL